MKWNDEMFEKIMLSYKNLLNNGWIKPPVRTLLYQLMGDYPDWDKKHYGQLCSFMQRKKDEGKLEYGLFSSSSGGAHTLVPTQKKIDEQIELWKNTTPVRLHKDNCLWLIFHEHEGMIPTLKKMFDYEVGSFSSQGQIRHEHLHEVMSEAEETLTELGGDEIRVIGIADYDIYGAKNIENGQGHIIRNHSEWIESNFTATFILYGITENQIKKVGLDANDEHQFDGWLQRYGLQAFRRDIRKLIGMNLKGGDA
ncbi:MAG: hypothetical protein UY48_C0013G0038 [Candidatus Gottesmanbacteria bacterium GW2011_GWB1_49_7]|uniref:Uncharacterized protein n=1 Tax=Candidatus Gottesmanbacteria bacterium GW2011_GWB1_49_7 TaxID=1618448 RepID=A0A0G1YA26_9BACT|nr:MAG: hypothetical protein UY48_C0013G0038 [Candidatus Gottesmanbacteria bacterium GW2011_GWB1_49_7]